MRSILTAFFAIAALLCSPNLVWLNWSTVRIENRGVEPVRASLIVCGAEEPLDVIEPGDYRFRVLSKCGDDTLKVSVREADVCVLYVESSMHHVEAWFTEPTVGDCEYGNPPFSPLLVTRVR